MLSDQARHKLGSILRSPALAVAVAYALRMFLLWFTQKEGAHPRLQVVGLEEGRVAWSLATGKGFFGPFPGYEAVTAWLAPGYPFVWAICLKLARLNSEALILIGQTINCVFSAATCWPIFAIGKRLFGNKVGLASAWTWALLPYAILMSLEWTWDQCMAAFLIAVIVEATFRLRDSMSPLAWSGYGMLWAVAALVNPALCGLLPFLLGWLAFQRWRSGVMTPALYARAVLLFFLAVLPWSVRNYYAVDGWVFVKSNFGVAMWVGNHPASLAIDPHPMDNFAERIHLILLGEAAFSKEQEHLAMAFIKSHPKEFIKITWNRILDTWSAKDDSLADGWIMALHLRNEDIWLCSFFSVLSFAGLLLALHARGMEPLPLALCVFLFPLPYYISLAEMRYRHPIDPFLTIFAVYASSRLWHAISPRAAIEPLQAMTSAR
jgi:hypothetical protein